MLSYSMMIFIFSWWTFMIFWGLIGNETHNLNFCFNKKNQLFFDFEIISRARSFGLWVEYANPTILYNTFRINRYWFVKNLFDIEMGIVFDRSFISSDIYSFIFRHSLIAFIEIIWVVFTNDSNIWFFNVNLYFFFQNDWDNNDNDLRYDDSAFFHSMEKCILTEINAI